MIFVTGIAQRLYPNCVSEGEVFELTFTIVRLNPFLRGIEPALRMIAGVNSPFLPGFGGAAGNAEGHCNEC